MFSSLFIKRTVEAVHNALESAAIADGTIGVFDQVPVGRGLSELGYDVLYLAAKSKSLRRIPGGQRVYGTSDALPLADEKLAAVVASGIAQREDWRDVLGEWSRVVFDRGAVVLIDRAPPTELTRQALCGGLTELEQRQAGRTVITSGRVIKF